MDLTVKIKAKAAEIGFDKVGITSPNTSLQYIDYYDEWIKSGKNGTMQWLARRGEERKDMTKYFPEVKSVISVAINYFKGTSGEVVDEDNQTYNFSNYAWGDDYHLIVKNKLNELLKYITEELKIDTKGIACVDTSPVMEKQWAVQAGIGWQGKNTLLLNNELGSWMFLGELLLAIQLDYDEPYTYDLCGNCTACVDACPVNALTEYQLDATKCISYLTVEYKSDFNEDQKNNLNGWIYGCDNCQQVCPWNKKEITISREEAFQPIHEVRHYSLNDWANLDNDSFKQLFKNSPVKRIKHQRFLRNVKAVQESRNLVD